MENLAQQVKKIYERRLGHNQTAAYIVDRLEHGDIQSAAVEYVRDRDKIPAWTR